MIHTKEEVLETVEQCLSSMEYWIPRISNEENKQRWIEYWSTMQQTKVAVTQGSETWTNTDEQLALVHRMASRHIDNLPPIRIAHPAEMRGGSNFIEEGYVDSYKHGMSCDCQWCESKKVQWSA